MDSAIWGLKFFKNQYCPAHVFLMNLDLGS